MSNNGEEIKSKSLKYSEAEEALEELLKNILMVLNRIETKKERCALTQLTLFVICSHTDISGFDKLGILEFTKSRIINVYTELVEKIVREEQQIKKENKILGVA